MPNLKSLSEVIKFSIDPILLSKRLIANFVILTMHQFKTCGKKFSFSKKLRLLFSNEFVDVFKDSHTLLTKEIAVFFKINNFQYPRIGIIITKKNIKQAYKRNNIKRLIRESFRLQQNNLPTMDYIIKIQKNINTDNHVLKKILENIWRYDYVAYLKNIDTTNICISNIHKSIN